MDYNSIYYEIYKGEEKEKHAHRHKYIYIHITFESRYGDD